MTSKEYYQTEEFKQIKYNLINKLMPHQNKALNFINCNSRGTIVMPTGTGKSLIIYADILNKISLETYDVFTIVSHRLLLNSQHLTSLHNEFLIHLLPYVGVICVGSEPIAFSEFKNNKNLNTKLRNYNIDINELISATTDIKEVQNLVKYHRENKRDVIIISTYNSLYAIKNIDIHTIYCDEAHKLATNNSSAFKDNYVSIKNIKNSYFFSATPKDLNIDDENKLTNEFLMNNKNIFGSREELTFKESLDSSLIVTPLFHILTPSMISKTKNLRTPENYKKIILEGFFEHIKHLKNRDKCEGKILIKCSSVDEIWSIFNLLKENDDINIFAGASKDENEKFGDSYKSNKKDFKNKTEFLNTLQKLKDSDKAIILHCNTLSEGIDVPGITGVMFLGENLPSISTIIQTIGRATRIHKIDRQNILIDKSIEIKDYDNMIKPYCYVLLPILSIEQEDTVKKISNILYELRNILKIKIEYTELGLDVYTGKGNITLDSELDSEYKIKGSLFIKDIKHNIEELEKEEIKKYNLSNIDNIFNYKGDNFIDNIVTEIKSGNGDLVYEKYYKNIINESISKVYTPIILREKMYENLELNKLNNICVLFNIEICDDFFKKGIKNVYFISDDKNKNLIVEKAYNYSTIYIEDIKNYNDFEQKIRDLKMKFDLIISNPPYGNVDLNILKKVYEHTDRILFVHPATWLYDNKRKSKLFNDCRELVKDHFIYYEKIEKPNEVFGINIENEIIISYIDKNLIGIGDKIYNIDQHENDEIYLSIKNKVLDYCKNNNNFLNHLYYSKDRTDKYTDKYCVSLSEIRGSQNQIINFNLIQKRDETKHLILNSEYRLKFYFDTKEEQINCFNYLKTKFARFCLSIYKINQSLNRGELASVPYFNFTKGWTNELCAKELNITDEELIYMINKIPNFYEEDFK